MLLLQIFGGLFYLLNKVFFSLGERNFKNLGNRWRICAWVVYLLGLPAITCLLVLKHNWIFASLEVAGGPSMVLGLVIAVRGKGHVPKWLNYLSMIMIIAGVGYSFHDLGVMTTSSQWLEVVTVVGFLVGTYQLAKQKTNGYLWLLLMSSAAVALFLVQDLKVMVLQQVISIGFTLDAYLVSRKSG